MKLIIALLILFFINGSKVFPQGGWTKITDPQNAVSQYTTYFPYVGASFVDINSDNLPDLFASPKTLFINQGNGRYVFAEALSLIVLNATAGSSWADLDNDGDNDVVVAATPSRVFLNNGSGSFTNATTFFPGLQNYGSWGCAIGEINEDRGLEVIFAHANGYHPGSAPEPCRFYFPGDTAFGMHQLNTGYSFSQQLSSYTSPFWSDYDLDGDMDLFLASGPANGTPAQDLCYKNMKKETGIDTLVRMTSELFAQHTQDGQCYNFIDYDNDGDFDLCITNYFSAPTRLYRNDGGVYNVVSTQFSAVTSNIANCWGDYDNDGDLDVIITNDNSPVRYFRNDAGSFNYLSGGLTTPTATNGATNGDYDNDGDLDVFFNGVGNNGNTSSVGLYRNDTAAENRKFINIKLTGIISNKSALGSVVIISSEINGTPVRQMREVNAQNSFQGQNDLRVHFGSGNTAVIDSVIIKWPKGLTETYTNISTNKFYNAVEGSGLYEIVTSGVSQISSQIPEGISLYQNFPNPFNPETKIKFSVPAGEKSKLQNVKLIIYDVSGKEIETLIRGDLKPGTYTADWNASAFPSGVYFYRLYGNEISITKAMIFLK